MSKSKETGISLGEISIIEPKLAFYIQTLKPFLEEYEKQNKRFPTWDQIKEKFPDDFGKVGPYAWFTNLVRKYNNEFMDKEKKKKNPHYSTEIGIALKVRMESITLVSRKRPGRGGSKVFTEEQAKNIAKLL